MTGKLISTIGIVIWIAMLSLSAKADDTNWPEAIQTVEASAKEYRDYAVRVGGTSAAGTMYNGYQYERHQCAILGRMLGRAEIIKHLEEMPYPPISTASDPHDLLVFSISLDNWVAAARWAISVTETERKNVWNLDCVGQQGIPSSEWQVSGTSAANFSSDGQQLHVYGDIDVGFYERFLEALDENPQVREVTLGSGGGSIRDALLAGIEIRKRGLNTTIYGNCFSACPLVFIGGVERVIWVSPHRLGFHQIYTGDGTPLPLNDPIYNSVQAYLELMGVDWPTVLTWMWSAAPAEMFEPELYDLCAPKVATFVQRVCNADGTW